LPNAATRKFTKDKTEWLGELIKMAKSYLKDLGNVLYQDKEGQ
jgi:hypothetical protein